MKESHRGASVEVGSDDVSPAVNARVLDASMVESAGGASTVSMISSRSGICKFSAPRALCRDGLGLTYRHQIEISRGI
jgi:hypothetical protein